MADIITRGSGAPEFLVLGLRLRPLSVGHLWLLNDIGSPLLSGKQQSFRDVLVAVFICSQDASESQKNLGAWWMPLLVKLWMFKCRKLDIVAEANTFSNYLGYWLEGPETKDVEGHESSSYGSPYVHRLIASCSSGLNMTPADALVMPVRTINFLLAALGEMRGTVKLWSQADQEFWEYAEEMDRKLAQQSKN